MLLLPIIMPADLVPQGVPVTDPKLKLKIVLQENLLVQALPQTGPGFRRLQDQPQLLA